MPLNPLRLYFYCKNGCNQTEFYDKIGLLKLKQTFLLLVYFSLLCTFNQQKILFCILQLNKILLAISVTYRAITSDCIQHILLSVTILLRVRIHLNIHNLQSLVSDKYSNEMNRQLLSAVNEKLYSIYINNEVYSIEI